VLIRCCLFGVPGLGFRLCLNPRHLLLPAQVCALACSQTQVGQSEFEPGAAPGSSERIRQLID
jgi:hypothetical protein